MKSFSPILFSLNFSSSIFFFFLSFRTFLPEEKWIIKIWLWGDDLSNKQVVHKNVHVENYKINLKNIWIQFHFYYTQPVRFCGLFSLSTFLPSINNIFLWIASLFLSIHLIVFFIIKYFFFVFVQSPTHIQLFVSPRTAAHLSRPPWTGLPVHHQLLEFTQTHVHWIGDAIQPPHHLSSPLPPALNFSQHQGLS